MSDKSQEFSFSIMKLFNFNFLFFFFYEIDTIREIQYSLSVFRSANSTHLHQSFFSSILWILQI